MSDSKTIQQQNKRLKAIQEFVETERTYVRLLKKLIDNYIFELKKDENTNIITCQEELTIFPKDIITIYNLNQEFLNSIESITKDWNNENSKIGNEILKYIPY